MKVKVTVSSEDGAEWVAEAKDLGLATTGASMMSAFERIQEEIQEFFRDAFGSSKRVEVICSKIKAVAAVTVSPLDPRPETPLDSFITTEPPETLLLTGQDLLEGEERLRLTSGDDTPNIGPSVYGSPGQIIDAEVVSVPQTGAVGE